MKMFLRVLAVGAFLFAAAGLVGSADAQDIFIPADNGSAPGAQSSGEEPPISIFSSMLPGARSAPESPTGQASGGNAAAAPSGSVGQAQATPSQIQQSSRSLVDNPEIARRSQLLMQRPPQTPEEFAAGMGIKPEQLRQALANEAAMSAANPGLQAVSAGGMLDMVTNGQRYQTALANRVKEACNMPNFSVLIDIPSFMAQPKARANLNANAIQPLGNMMNDMCSDPRQREKVSQNFYMIRLVQKAGADQASVTNNDGVFTITADYGRDEPPPTGAVRNSILSGLDRVEQKRQQMTR